MQLHCGNSAPENNTEIASTAFVNQVAFSACGSSTGWDAGNFYSLMEPPHRGNFQVVYGFYHYSVPFQYSFTSASNKGQIVTMNRTGQS